MYIYQGCRRKSKIPKSNQKPKKAGFRCHKNQISILKTMVERFKKKTELFYKNIKLCERHTYN